VRFLTLGEVVELHRRLVVQTGGATSLRDLNGLESAVAQPRMSAGGADAYPTLAAKAAALGFSLIQNHPFVDGNKRVGHAAMATFLLLNGFELQASVDEAEDLVLGVASGTLGRPELAAWIEGHLVRRPS
jgi:death-on-curing protein